MTNLETRLPDALFRQMQSITEREQISFDEFIAIAVAGQVSAWTTGANFAERAAAGDWQKARQILAAAPDVEPETFDQ